MISRSLAVSVLGSTAWAVYGVRISDLGNSPQPPNPIRVWGKVTSESPLRLSDGRDEITVIGLTAVLGDYLVVTGDWNGGVLTVSGDISQGLVRRYVGPASVEMIYIPAGSFLMGNSGIGNDLYYDQLGRCESEKPQHSIYLSGYYIGKYEVTRGEYRAFMNAGGYSNSSYWSAEGWNWRVNNSRTEPYCWAANQDWGSGTFTQTDSHPVVGVCYYEAEAFCNWAGGHLPTEAQWERAARWTGSHPNVYPWGDTWNQEYCNNYYDSNPAGGGYQGYQTAPVGSYPSGASPCGCQDMAGNVWEWCRDWYSSSYYSQSPSSDPQGPTSGSSRVLRGGGWDLDDYHSRCAGRYYDLPYDFWYDFGFRMAR